MGLDKENNNIDNKCFFENCDNNMRPYPYAEKYGNDFIDLI